MTTTATAARLEVVATVADLDVSTDQKSLASALQFLNQVLPNRSTLPVLSGVLIEGSESNIAISAFDYEMSGTEIVAGAGSGRALVPGKTLLDFVKSMDKGARITMCVKDKKLVLNGDGVTYRIELLPLDEYPALPVTAAAKTLCALGAQHLAGIVDVTQAAGRDDTLPVLTGVHFSPEVVTTGKRKGATLRVAATDRYRLAVYDTGITVSAQLASFLVPASTITKVAKAFKDKVSLKVIAGSHRGETIVVFTDGVRTVTGRTLDGEFPKYRSLLPDRTELQVTAEAKVLSKAVRQVAIAVTRTSPFRITTGADEVLLEGGNDCDDVSAAKRVDAAVTGDAGPLTMGFNPSYFLDGLAAVGKESVVLSIVAPTKPAVIVGVGRPEYQYLIMPVRLAG